MKGKVIEQNNRLKYWKHQVIALFANLSIETLAKAIQEDQRFHDKHSLLLGFLELQATARQYVEKLEDQDDLMAEAIFRVAAVTYEHDDRVDFDDVIIADDVLDMREVDGSDGLFIRGLLELKRKSVEQEYEDIKAEEDEGKPF